MEALILTIALANAICLFCCVYCVILLRNEVTKLKGVSSEVPQRIQNPPPISQPSKRKPVVIDDHRAAQLEREHFKKREIDLE